MALIAELETKLTVNSREFQSGMATSLSSINGFLQGAKQLAIVGVIFHELHNAASAFTNMLSQTTEKVSQLVDTSTRLGAGIPELQRLHYAAEQSGLSIGEMDKSLTFLLKNLSLAANGNSALSATFKSLNLDAKELTKLGVDQQYIKIADAIKSIKSPADQTRIAMQLLGRGGARELSLMKDNVQGLTQEFTSLGGELTTNQAKAIEAYGDSVRKLEAVWDAFSLQLTAALAGPFKSLLDYISKTTIEMGGMGNVAKAFASAIISGISSAIGSLSSLISFVDKAIIKFEQLAIVMLRISQIATLGLSNINLPFGAGGAGDKIASLKDSIAARQASMTDPNSFTNKAQSGLNALQGQLMQNPKLEVTVKADSGLNVSVAESPAIRAKVLQMIYGGAASAAAGVSL